MPGMREVARLAGVSLSTVSVVLSGRTDKFVSPENRRRVEEAAEALSYRLPPKKEELSQKTIGVILPIITSPFFPSVLAGIGAVAREQGYTLLYCDSNYSFEKERAYLGMLSKHPLRGIIIDSLCSRELEADYFGLLREEFTEKLRLPVVFLERSRELPGFYSVGVDNFSNAYRAAGYLIGKGHRRIAHIRGNEMYASSGERFAGYCQALKDSGIPLDDRIIRRGDFTTLGGYAAMKEQLSVCSDFTALFSANDQMAIGAIKAIKESGRRVPEDISVVGFDNISHASMINPALTTVSVPAYQLGSTAAQMIVDVQAGRCVKRCRRLEATLIVRKSSDPYASNEWDIMSL